MADAISIQELIDARTDAKTLEEAVNGDAVTTVLSRLGETYPTLSNALNQIDSKLDSADAQIKQGITDLFQNGGLPAEPFPTLAEMETDGAALADGKYAQVTDDTVNNGLYVKTAGAWVKSGYDPLTQANTYTDGEISSAIITAAADATTKAITAEANAKNYTKERTIGVLSQKVTGESNIGVLISDRRGAATWLQTDAQGMPTTFVKDTFKDALAENLNHNIGGENGGFVVSDRRGVALIDTSSEELSVSTKYDLTTVSFHGSSTMRKMQQELFDKLRTNFSVIKTAVFTNANAGGVISDLSTEIGINDGSLKFTDNVIYANEESPAVAVNSKYGLPANYDIPIILTNGITGTIKATGFTADNIDEDFSLIPNLEIYFQSVSTEYANSPSIVNLGKNDMGGDNTTVVTAIIAMTRDAVSFLDKENGMRTLVVGHTTNRSSTPDFIQNVKDVNARLKSLYYKRYFDLFAYTFGEQIWIDTGLTKTSEDIAAIAANTLPPSFTIDGVHLNSTVNTAVTTKIVEFIKTLGWY